jgi:3-oxoacyl-[acyl-carrier-protein] synthase II
LKKVAVTGLGIISPLGNSPEVFYDNLIAGRSGIKKTSPENSSQGATYLAAPADFNAADYFSRKQVAVLDRTSQLALAAASQAWRDSATSLDGAEKERAGVYFGTGMGGAPSLDEACFQLYRKEVSRVSPLSIIKIMSNAPASHISIQYGLTGPCLSFSTACSSSSIAIGEAFRQIKAGCCDVMLAGGSECLLTYVSFKCWGSLGVLAIEDLEDPSSSCRPFSKDRTGFVLGEGAAVIVLEEMERAKTRGAYIYGELTGYGSTCDAYHITGPSVIGQSRAMRLAMEEAGAGVDDIDYINAHGTATVLNDLVETQAIKTVFGERAYKIPISSTKSMHGHLMGAGGAIEFVTSLLAIKNRSIPPTANLRTPDPECDLDYVPNIARTGLEIKTVMSNSFAFGGTNSVLIAREA